MNIRKDFTRAGDRLTVSAERLDGQRWRVQVGDSIHEVDAHRTPDGRVAMQLGGRLCVAAVAPGQATGDLMVRLGGSTFTLRAWQGRSSVEAAGSGRLEAPMTGTVLAVHVALGDHVEAGRTVAVMTAMKMEHKLIADVTGTVAELGAEPGGQIEAGAALVRIEPDLAPEA